MNPLRLTKPLEDKYSLEYWTNQLDERWLETMRMVHRGKNIDECIKLAFADLISQDERLERSDASDFKRLVNSWLSNRKPEPKKRDISHL